MSSQGASLQNYNTELIKMLESIKESRGEVQQEIDTEELEENQIEDQMRQMSVRLGELNETLGKKYKTRTEFDKTIGETENAFMKILESSQTLLHVLKKEGTSLSKKKANTMTATAPVEPVAVVIPEKKVESPKATGKKVSPARR